MPKGEQPMKTKLILPVILSAGLYAHAADTCRVYLGTSAKGDLRGIYMSELDMTSGTLSEAVRVSQAERPGFITLDSKGEYLYATGPGGRSKDRQPEAVSAFRILPDGHLTDLNSEPTGGIGPCHVTLDQPERHLLTASYQGGSCAVLPIREDGSLAPVSSVQRHTGSSVNPKRQTKAFAHSINSSPDGRFVFVADLGIDKIMIYRYDAAAGVLTPNDPPSVNTEPGGGPRHFTFHPGGRFAYTNLELSNRVTAYSYDADEGILRGIQTVSTLPPDYERPNTTAEILTSPDGRFLYVSNRGHNSIAIFSIDPESGMLTFVAHQSVHGEIPRNFNIDPTGTYLIAANQKSSNVAVFRIDRETGRLTFTGSEIKVIVFYGIFYVS
jgi:6-phosphogluconolactonase